MELFRFSILLRIQDRAKVFKAQNQIGGDTAQKKCIAGGGDTAHIFWTGCQQCGWEGHRTYFLNGRPIGGGHRTSKQAPSTNYKFGWLLGGWLGGWVGGWPSDYSTTSWLHFASRNLPDSQASWESKMEPECGNKEEIYLLNIMMQIFPKSYFSCFYNLKQEILEVKNLL